MRERKVQQFAAGALTWTDAQLWNQFDDLCKQSPNAVALIDTEDKHWTRAEMHEMATNIANAMRDAGVRAHERVLLEAPANATSFASLLAVSAVDGIVCPVAPDLGPGDRAALERRLGHAVLLGYSLADRAVIPTTQGLRVAMTEPATRSDDPRNELTALIGFTSGTTGVPKGVMHTYASLNYATRAMAEAMGLKDGHRILCSMPHLGGAPAYTFGGHIALTLGLVPVLINPWVPLTCLERINKFSCAWGMCVPTQVTGMIEAARTGQWTQRTSPMIGLTVGGAAMTPDLVTLADELLGIKVLRMFAMSECMGHTGIVPGDTLERRLYWDGRPFAGTSEEAFDTDMRALPRGHRGQAGVRGPSLSIGYCIGMGEENYKLTPDGFFLTGDEILRDEEGYVQVTGRIKDMIIRGGFNIYPAEVEAALEKFEGLSKVAIVSVPDPKLGERACAICVVRQGAQAPDLNSIKEHLAGIGLSKKKWPEYLLLVPDLQYTLAQKVDKKSLSKWAIGELGLVT